MTFFRKKIGFAETVNLIAIVCLSGAFALAGAWQRDGLIWIDAEPGKCLMATLCLGLYVTFCAWSVRMSSRHITAPPMAFVPDDSSPPMLVVFASQTGFAENIAARTAKALSIAGVAVRLVSMATLDTADLLKAERAIFIVSTYGEGDPPDMAGVFVHRLLRSDVQLDRLQFGMLALGDRDYTNFCGFGRQLDAWLRKRQARTLFDCIEVDNADEGSLRRWQHQLGALSGAADQAEWCAPRFGLWRLVERRALNPGSAGDACFHLVLKPEIPADAHWEAGDVAEISPRNSATDVNSLLAANGLDGAAAAPTSAGAVDAETLNEYLARCRLPDPGSIVDQPSAIWLADLLPLAHREYSIASIPSDGAVHLLVRQRRCTDGRLGVGAGWLTEHAAVGQAIQLRLRTNTNFHMPVDDRPLILIGNGTGIAGLRALLKARIAAEQRSNWLVFGERSEGVDFFYEGEIRAWHAAGWIAQLDLAFSRDQEQRIYVQQRIRNAADMLRRWVGEGAAIHVCGSLLGMAPAVDAVLRESLGGACVDDLISAGRYRRDVY
ncbi:MAG: sulfite reductase flavoprotein subunit alpha [Tahibacter sp.]